MVEMKTPGEVDAIRAAGRRGRRRSRGGSRVRCPGGQAAGPGRRRPRGPRQGGRDLAVPALQAEVRAGPLPAVICTSVNDAALHGIPGKYQLKAGDLLSVDAGATLDGWVADAAISFSVGTPANGDAELIATTQAALEAGITAAVPGGRLGDISAAIAKVGDAGRYGISTELGGHGVGRTMHEDPHIPNRGRAGRGMRLTPGLVIAIEPWFMAGGRDDIYLDDDGWTVRTADGSRAAHAEHTVAVTSDGPVILTAG